MYSKSQTINNIYMYIIYTQIKHCARKFHVLYNLNKKKFTIDLPSLSHHTCLMYNLAVFLKTSPIKNSCPWPVFLGNKLFLRDNRQNLCFLPMRNSIWIHLVISSNQLYIIKSVSKLFVHCLKLRHFKFCLVLNQISRYSFNF